MKELKKFMTVGITDDGQCGINVSPDMDCATALQLIGTLALHTLNAFYLVASQDVAANKTLSKTEKDAALKGTKESMYDAADSVFSNLLTQFYPDAARLAIEDEAILQLTNELIEKRYNALSDADKKAFKKHYDMQKLRMTFNPDSYKPKHESKPSKK